MNSSLVLAEVITFAVLLIIFLLFFGRTKRSILRLRRSVGNRENSTHEILDRRYANGELSREDYLRIRGDITGRNDA